MQMLRATPGINVAGVWGSISPNALGRSETRPYVETSAADLAGGRNETIDRQPCHAR
jgi:hypothetical protein